MRNKIHRRPCAATAVAALTLLSGLAVSGRAEATEGGASLYLLGSGGPGAAILPPLEGVFLVNTFYHYDGKAGGDRQFLVGGNLVAGLKANINANFTSLAWVPSTDVMGGTLMLGGILPFGVPAVDVDAVLTGPRGRAVAVSRSQDRWTVGDPVLMGSLGWRTGDVWLQAGALVNVPIGDYQSGDLSNLSFNRWAVDTSFAVTWKPAKSGWDLSMKTGLTFNGKNPATDYNSGDEWHVEAAIEKTLSPKWSLGVQAYYFSQITRDTGAGARLGPFKGQVTGVGATAAYNFKIAKKIPATLRLHGFTETGAKNRLEGDAVMLDFSMPLWVKMPPTAHP